MGIVKYGPLVEQISGKVGGCVFAAVRGNYAVRQWAKKCNPPSFKPQNALTTPQYHSKRWLSGLTAAQRSDWNAYAATVSFTDPLGHAYSPPGYSMFIRNSIILNRFLAADPPIDPHLAPTATGFPADCGISLSLTDADGHFELAATDPDPAPDLFLCLAYKNSLPSTQSYRSWSTVETGAITIPAILPCFLRTYSIPSVSGAGMWAAPCEFYFVDSNNRVSPLYRAFTIAE